MAPLVLGGALRPRHAIGARAALALTQAKASGAIEAGLFDRVRAGRVRRARRLLPLDVVAAPTDGEWALSASLNDVLQAASPTFQGPLRRSMAARILELAIATIDRIEPPATVGEALSRHTWFAALPDLTRTDSSVTWWAGSRVFRGEPPPARLQAWPGVRRVSVVATEVPLLDLTPLAVDRERLALALTLLLDRSPLTALATCTRGEPPFAWSDATLALVARGSGRTLALRALERLAPAAVDAALGRATRSLLEHRRDVAGPALAVLSDRVLAIAIGHTRAAQASSAPADAVFANAVGAAVALRRLEAGEPGWADDERKRIWHALKPAASSDAGRGAAALLQEPA